MTLTPPAPGTLPQPKKSARIDSVDALRGFALFGILLLHNVEQFNFYHTPDHQIDFLKAWDPAVWTSLFFLFGGKAYAIFSFLFGFSFWVQFSRMQAKNYDMGGRFAWRLVLLFTFGLIHSVYYSGDLLIFYATFGLLLIPLRRVSDWVVLACSAALLLMPLKVGQLLCLGFDPSFSIQFDRSYQYWGALAPAQGGGTLWDLVVADVTSGLKANVVWTWEVGRMAHIPGLFLLGMLAARRKAFTDWATRSWAWVFVGSLAVFIPLNYYVRGLLDGIANETVRRQLGDMMNGYVDVAFMIAIVSAFILLWRAKIGERVFSALIPYGRMSLTNYMSQALLGTFVYYEFGLGLHHYFGATLSLLTGFVLVSCQIAFSHWWLARHTQGPLETLWRKLMWIGAPEGIRK